MLQILSAPPLGITFVAGAADVQQATAASLLTARINAHRRLHAARGDDGSAAASTSPTSGEGAPGTSATADATPTDQVLEQLLSQVTDAPTTPPVSEAAANLVKALFADAAKKYADKDWCKALSELLPRPQNLVGVVPKTNPPIYKNLSDKAQRRDGLLQKL